jgi:dihydropteroate synthase
VRLRLRETTIELDGGEPLLMGIVNTNPDSFSDAVRLDTLDRQTEHALGLVADGAAMVDVGGESGVTYTDVSGEDVEAQRVVPLVRRLVDDGVTVSVDTWKASVAQRALEAGAHIVNDTSGLADPRIAELCAARGAALVVMHTRAAPKVVGFPTTAATSGATCCASWTSASGRSRPRRRGRAADRRSRARLRQDAAESIAVMADLKALHALGRPVLAAISRKYFVGAISGRPPHERLAGTLAALGEAADAGAAILRVHDVRDAADFLAVRAVLRGERPLPEFDAGDERLKWIRSTEE